MVEFSKGALMDGFSRATAGMMMAAVLTTGSAAEMTQTASNSPQTTVDQKAALDKLAKKRDDRLEKAEDGLKTRHAKCDSMFTGEFRREQLIATNPHASDDEKTTSVRKMSKMADKVRACHLRAEETAQKIRNKAVKDELRGKDKLQKQGDVKSKPPSGGVRV